MTPLSPTYYKVGGVEAADIAGHLTFHAGNALKYIVRSSRVDGVTKYPTRTGHIEDLHKARTCIDMEIARLEKITKETAK